MPKKKVEATAYIGDSYLIDIKAGHFSFHIDQPKPVGIDTAPTPLEYFLASLGGCMCTIGKTIAQQRKLEVKKINVRVVGEIDTDFLLGKVNEGRAGFTNIKMYIEIDAPISLEEKKELATEIEKRCPLSDNVSEKSNIEVIIEN